MSIEEIEEYVKFILKTLGWTVDEKFLLRSPNKSVEYFAYVGGKRLLLFVKSPNTDNTETLFNGTLYGDKKEIQEQLRFILVSCVGDGNTLRVTQGNLEASLFLRSDEKTHTIEESIEIVKKHSNKTKTTEEESYGR